MLGHPKTKRTLHLQEITTLMRKLSGITATNHRITAIKLQQSDLPHLVTRHEAKTKEEVSPLSSLFKSFLLKSSYEFLTFSTYPDHGQGCGAILLTTQISSAPPEFGFGKKLDSPTHSKLFDYSLCYWSTWVGFPKLQGHWRKLREFLSPNKLNGHQSQ